MKTFKLLFILTLIATSGTLNHIIAQENIVFDHLTTEDGLSQNDVNAIYQDHQGFMWFATHDGLNKYDGYEFKVFTPDPNKPGSINSNLVFDILGEENGNLWIGTTGSGLNYYERSTNRFRSFKHDSNNPSSLIRDHISVLKKDQNGYLWVGTTNGVDRLNLNKSLDSVKFEHISMEHDPIVSNLDQKRVYEIYETSKNQLLVGGIGGVFKLSRDQNGISYFKPINEQLGLPSNINVQSIREDQQNRLVLGSSLGLFIYPGTKNRNKAERFSDGNYHDIAIDNKNQIWAGSNNGLVLFRSHHDQLPQLVKRFIYNPLKPNSITKNIIKSLTIDKTGILWVGTNGGGVSKYDPKRKQFTTIKKTLDSNSLSYDKIRSMFEDSNGTLWIGTEGGGLNMLSESSNNYEKFLAFKGVSKPFALSETVIDNKKTLLIGAESNPGLYQLDISDPKNISKKEIKRLDNINNSVFALLTDRQDNVWIGTYGGGVKRWIRDNANGTFNKDALEYSKQNENSLSSDIIRSMFQDSHGNIWFGTGNGLSMLTKEEAYRKNPKFKVFKNDNSNHNSLSHNYVLSLFESSNGDIWIGTFGGGLNKYIPPTGTEPAKFESFTNADGLPNNVIKGILEDNDKNLWLSTNQGLSRFNMKTKTFRNFDVNDGLQSNEFQELAALKRKNGEMLFGGVNGFNVFYPEDIEENTIASETVITEFSIFNKPVKVDEEFNNRIILNQPLYDTKAIKLKHWENSISFQFASLHYAAPQKNKFAYKLEGFDKNWINTDYSKRFATYTNLEPGAYTLKVKASNNDGIWDETPSTLEIKIVPPFWQTGWAYALYGAIALLILFAYRKFTIIKTTEKHRLELEHLEKEKYEEMQQMKLEFFTNISHEFRTPLTLIKGPLEYLLKKGNEISATKAKEQYSLMQKNTDYLMRLVNQLLDFRKVGQGKARLVVRHSNAISFIKEVGEPFQFTAHRRDIKFNIISEKETLFSWFDHEALEKIINNLLSNAFKFTPEFGAITIEISEDVNQQIKSELALDNSSISYLYIQVKDTGSGIPKESVTNIFERFYVEQDKEQKNLNGAGIGLSFVKNLVELHQGKIAVTSERNVQTNFIVALPIERITYTGIDEITIKEETENDFSMRSSEAESFAISLNDEILDNQQREEQPKLPSLLIVDDNPDIRSFIRNTLEEEYTIYEAENGKEGYDQAVSLIPNIILTDIVMPIMDGLELCEKIKTRTVTSHIPVVMITAKSSQESEVEGLTNGADDYIRKPFDIELLQLKLKNIMTQRDELRKRFNREITLQPKEVTVTSSDELFLQQAIETVEKHMTNTDFNVEMMVKEMGQSRSNLYLKFKEITGLSSSEFIRNIRLKRAVQLFDQSDLSVKEIMYMTGFNTASYFSKCFKKQFGMIPSEYVAKRKLERKPLKI